MERDRGGTVLKPPRRDESGRVLALLQACDVAEYGVPDTQAEDLEWMWSLPRFDLELDARVIEAPPGILAGYAAVDVRADGTSFDADVSLHPEHGADVGPALLAFLERRTAERVPSGKFGELAIPAAAVNRAKRELLEAHAYRPKRTFFRMEIDLAPDGLTTPSVPDGIEVRRFRHGLDDGVLYEAMEEAFSRHYRHVRLSAEEWAIRRFSHPNFDPDLWFVAWDGERVAAAILNYPAADAGWVTELGVRPPWRGRGLGMALLLTSFAAFAERGQRRVALGVDAENVDGATRLYERAGMHVTKRFEIYLKSIPAAA
ncbi:MAG TPA: GNAT family N-acetyltransferase [Candidatus Limnocylindria bacterium]|nr:GNAT family N-acetyltransferase [Candidatus Limnocylindria bacterium]